MMRSTAFASRNSKELLRDPLNLAFGLGFPVIVMLLLTAIQANVPVALFEIHTLTPGLAVFGLSFITLFSGTLIATDRGTSFLARLFASPLTAADFILGYILPLLPMAIAQCAVCFAVAALLGLTINLNVLLALAVLVPAAVLFIAVGLLCGSLFNEKQVGGICGGLLTNLSAWLSGAWFDLNLVGGLFSKIAYVLPFAHAVESARAAVSGEYVQIMPHLWWVIGYAAVILVLAILVFKRKMSREQ